MLEVSRSDYIRTARAKGLSERRVVWGHGFKNSVFPVLTIVGIDLGPYRRRLRRRGDLQPSRYRLLLLDATSGRDPAVIAGCTIFVSFFFVVCNLLVDLAYAWVDPRVRLGD